MAQIWYYLAICLILGSCGITKCTQNLAMLENDFADENELVEDSNIHSELPNDLPDENESDEDSNVDGELSHVLAEKENVEDSNVDSESSNIPADFKIISAKRSEIRDRDIFHAEDAELENHGGSVADETELRGKLGLANIPPILYNFDKKSETQDKDNFYRGDAGMKKNNRDGTANDDKPVRAKSCVYPYRSNVPDHCTYFVRFGKYKKGDKLISHKTLDHPWSRWSITRYGAGYTEFIYPSNDESNDVTIGSIYIEDLKGSERLHEDLFYMLEGGVGHKSFKLRIESYQYTSGYEIYIYG